MTRAELPDRAGVVARRVVPGVWSLGSVGAKVGVEQPAEEM